MSALTHGSARHMITKSETVTRQRGKPNKRTLTKMAVKLARLQDMYILFVVGGCVSCAVRLCAGERSDGLLVAWRFYDGVLDCSSTRWLLSLSYELGSGVCTGGRLCLLHQYRERGGQWTATQGCCVL